MQLTVMASSPGEESKLLQDSDGGELIKSSGTTTTGVNSNYSTLPRSYSRLQTQLSEKSHKGDNFLMRLMRHFSLNSISTSSSSSSSSSNSYSNRNYSNVNNGYLTMTRCRHGSSCKQLQFPSSVSNGDIRQQVQQQQVSSSSSLSGSVPAVTGIKNHGNTCFMNAILQCLSNTDFLAEYFVMDYYKHDLLRRNKLHAKKYGTRGEVTEQMACLLKSIWSNEYSPEISTKFKLLVAKYGTQYEGSDQHDAQEFLLWLLDKIHEDLNVATKKKYKKFKTMFNHNRPDEVIAAETLANHVRCNSSFIHELFQAQLRSSLVCRSCGNHSNTFDPYLCLSLPVPARQTHTIIVNVSYMKKTPKEVKIGVSIEAQASLRELRDKISRLIKVPERQLVLLIRESELGLKELAKDTDTIVDILEDMQQVDAVECLAVQQPMQLVIDSSSPSPTEQFLILIWSNCSCNGNGKLFGPLFSCRVSREASYKQIQTEIMSSMKSIIRKEVDLGIIVNSIVFRLRVITDTPGKRYLPEDVDHPLYTSMVDSALLHCEKKDYRGPLHLKLIAEWDENLRNDVFIANDDIPSPEVDPNLEYVKARAQKANRASLSDCFDLYFREEKLAADNAWMCPSCRKRQQCEKKLSLWSVPDVFVVHLKRFRQASSTHRSKISTLIQFPLRSLDMNPYLALNNKMDQNYQKRSSINGSTSDFPIVWSSWQRNRILSKPSARSQDNIYDLYAVCNHHGNMQGGHYTAYCKNPVDRKWHLFDDHKVSAVAEEDVTTPDAYILFYQRKTSFSSVSSCASSSTSGYSSASSCYSVDHWAFRMPLFHYWSPKSSRSQDNLCDSQRAQNSSSTSSSGTGNSISRGQKIYASLPSRSHHQKSTAGAVQNNETTLTSTTTVTTTATVIAATTREDKDTGQAVSEESNVDSRAGSTSDSTPSPLHEEKQHDTNGAKVETKSYTDSLTKKYWTVTSV